MTRKEIFEKPHNFSWKARIRSFGYAGSGIYQFFRNEHNAWIHLGASVVVVFLSIVLRVSRSEVFVLLFCIGLVWITEMINTAIEKMADLLSKEFDPRIGAIKDLAAGAVLVAAIVSVIAGLVIFLPKIFSL